MRKWNAIAGTVLVCALGTLTCELACGQDQPPPPDQNQNQASGRRGGANFNPQRMQQMFMNRIKETLGVSEEGWKTLQPKLEKVMTLSRETGSQGGRMGFGPGGMNRRGGPGGQGGNAPAGAPAADAKGQPQGGQTTAAAGQAQPPASETVKATQALQTALEDELTADDEIKTDLGALRDARKKAKEQLAEAQADLLKGLTPRQEAQLVLMGILE